jgi:hypothetical protein
MTMTDVKRRLRLLDGLEPPDVWGDAATRTPRHDVSSDRPTRRGPAIALAFAVSVASIAFVVRAVGDGTDDFPRPTGPSPAGTPAGDVRYEASATVLQDGKEPTMLCLGGILLSLPPQCGTIPITNWDWAAVPGEERLNGVRWGNYHVVGTYDGDAFTLAETPGPYEAPPPGPQNVVRTPCEEPAGGWPVPDPSKVGDADYRRAINAAEKQPDFAGAWIDGTPTELTLAFTGDLERHDVEARREWGGPLCLWQFERTFDELRRIQRDLEATARELGLRLLSTSDAVYRNQVELGVVLADDAALREIEERYGPGAVVVDSALEPVP